MTDWVGGGSAGGWDLEVHITTDHSRYSQNGSCYLTEEKEEAPMASGHYSEMISYCALSARKIATTQAKFIAQKMQGSYHSFY